MDGSDKLKPVPQKGALVWSAFFAAVPLALVLFIFVLPYLAANAAAFLPGAPSPALLYTARLAAWTASQAALSTLAALILGLPAAYLISSPSFKYRKFFRVFTAIPFALPPVIMSLGFIIFWGNSGIVNKFLALLEGGIGSRLRLAILYKPSALIFCSACYNFPLVMRLASDAFTRIRRSCLAPAYSLGASPLRAAIEICFPLAIPAIISASLLVFLYSLSSFTIAMLLGGRGSATLAVEIYRFGRVTLDFKSAGVLAVIETLISAAAFLAYTVCEKRNKVDILSVPSEKNEVIFNHKLNFPVRAARFLYFALLIVIALGPLCAVAADSFFVRGSRAGAPRFSLSNYMLSSSLLEAALNSCILACAAASISVLLALLSAEAVLWSAPRRALPVRAAVLIPAASSGITLGLGAIALYGRGAPSYVFAALLHALAALPFAYNSVYSSLSAVPRRILHAAAALGAGPIRRLFSVDAPLCAAGLRSAWAFAACISLGESNLMISLGGSNFNTLPLYIYRAAASYRYGPACAAGLILMICCFFALEISNRQHSPADLRAE